MGAFASRRPFSSSSNRSPMSPREPDADVIPEKFLRPESNDEECMCVMTWNIAAVNNNPFEYWVKFDDPVYDLIMQGVEGFLQDPGEYDVAVREVFTEAMFQDLKTLMEAEKLKNLDEVEAMWHDSGLKLSGRKIVTEFLKDKQLGAKRLMSMPDRITNTINVVTKLPNSEYIPPPACRPCVINNYEGDLSTMGVWWDNWKRFMFQQPLTVRTKIGCQTKRPVEMLEPILASKYPAATEEEERITVPLQILCCAIFDAVCIHLMNTLSPDMQWQRVKTRLCNSLYRGKNTRTLDILSKKYAELDIMCLQEVAGVFKDMYRETELKVSHELVLPMKLDGKRDQNSIVMLRKDRFNIATCQEVTPLIEGAIEGDGKLADGDLMAITVQCVKGRKYLIVSFHGDTTGLLSLPIVNAVSVVSKAEEYKGHHVILGLDANVYTAAGGGKMTLEAFSKGYVEKGFTSCWGDIPDPAISCTTCCSRTSLQPQFNKAIPYVSRIADGDINPKDIVLFDKQKLRMVTRSEMGSGRQNNPVKDNTGELKYNERSVFPTLDFPSDHGILCTALRPI